MKTTLITATLLATLAATGCDSSGNTATTTSTSTGTLTGLRSVDVFGIKLFAAASVPDAKLLHAANVMAQYLDNNADGSPDNLAVVNKMVELQATMVMMSVESELATLEAAVPNMQYAQDLRTDETLPEGIPHVAGANRFDATLEEVLHLITHVGYAGVYPQVFGEQTGTVIADAMDIARGGQFISTPASYPAGAWYSYTDATCDYSCMVTEYIYWGLTSKLGAQSTRATDIGDEWRLNTPALFQSGDVAAYTLFNDAQYAWPTTLPDGQYSAQTLTIIGQ